MIAITSPHTIQNHVTMMTSTPSLTHTQLQKHVTMLIINPPHAQLQKHVTMFTINPQNYKNRLL